MFSNAATCRNISCSKICIHFIHERRRRGGGGLQLDRRQHHSRNFSGRTIAFTGCSNSSVWLELHDCSSTKQNQHTHINIRH